jgi:hypothetical protein
LDFLNSIGIPVYQKKFEYSPSCIHTFHNVENSENYEYLKEGKKSNIGYFSSIIGSNTGHLLVYRNMTLMWAASTPHIPIYVNTINLENLNSMIVTLSDNGFLQVKH